jgi:hypothetical protein
VPYSCEHRGFDIDRDGHWNPHGLEYRCSAFTAQFQISISNTRCLPPQGSLLYVTHTCQWNNARSDDRHETRTGCHERANI